jgi:hypothetical protein
MRIRWTPAAAADLEHINEFLITLWPIPYVIISPSLKLR